MSLAPHGNFGRRNNMVGSFQTDSNSLSAMNSEMAAEPAAFANIHIDRKETPEAHIYTADLPGLREEELKVEISGRNLQISGVRSIVEEKDDGRGHKSRRSSSSSFSRQFNLPDNASVVPDQIRYIMDNGVLTVTVPKVFY